MSNGRAVYDHKGTPFPSVRAMCDAYGLTVAIYHNRRQKGMSIAEALSLPMKSQSTICTDYAGRIFPSKACMFAFLGISRSRSHKTPLKISICGQWENRNCGSYHVIRCIDFPWFKTKVDNHEIIVHFDKILDEFHASGPDPLENMHYPAGVPKPIARLTWPMYHVRLPNGTETETDYRSIINDWIRCMKPSTQR